MFMMTFYFSRVTDLTYAKSAPEHHSQMIALEHSQIIIHFTFLDQFHHDR